MADWHPIMAAEEYQPGHWVMLDAFRKPYGLIVFVRRGDALGYRADRWAQDSADRELVGYYRTLRGACSAIHTYFIADHSPKGHPADSIIERRYPEWTTTANTPLRTERD
ncbi:MAG: hypothetical protein JWP85_1000 [Rhodoglobus sp.]|nr:hypothetical protein [Rhodoglobus sp.]